MRRPQQFAVNKFSVQTWSRNSRFSPKLSRNQQLVPKPKLKRFSVDERNASP
jgi:hypothetical protein